MISNPIMLDLERPSFGAVTAAIYGYHKKTNYIFSLTFRVGLSVTTLHVQN